MRYLQSRLCASCHVLSLYIKFNVFLSLFVLARGTLKFLFRLKLDSQLLRGGKSSCSLWSELQVMESKSLVVIDCLWERASPSWLDVMRRYMVPPPAELALTVHSVPQESRHWLIIFRESPLPPSD